MPTPVAAQVGQTRDAALDLLKWLALLSMLLDHLRYVWPALYWLYVPGRLAFPLFCLAIAANLRRQPPGRPLPLRYLGLLLGFALLSEWPYRLLVPAPQTLNILPTLALGLLLAQALARPGGSPWPGLGALALALLGHPWLMFGAAGALLPAAFVQALHRPRRAWPWPVALCLLANYWPPLYADALEGDAFALAVVCSCALAPLVGIGLLQRQLRCSVAPVGRWAYGFYPGHFLALAGLREVLP
ncbi:conjugal transfer protein TraX [Pseudomonas lalucatii]|uniref:Conjugal transfer protein TraX n=1 Tax=Pseudomonas lalucatii TaxID=1424203 RepID=A0ABS5Q6P7_9PSED|nr:TraX family protein [Pseudomonas lalucatii]MBS7664295.1 conjugal transfer protein TraX [Pseudomonas lalucatii]QVM86521.1 conjugal transfer protein TraX [Pseudomonas lalucatii]